MGIFDFLKGKKQDDMHPEDFEPQRTESSVETWARRLAQTKGVLLGHRGNETLLSVLKNQ